VFRRFELADSAHRAIQNSSHCNSSSHTSVYFFYVDPKTIHQTSASATAVVSDRSAIPRVRSTRNQFVCQPTSKKLPLLATNKTRVLVVLATHTDIKSSPWNRYLFSYINQYFYFAVIYAMFGGTSRLCKHLQCNMLIKINSVILEVLCDQITVHST
jgi:hypothetical protein